MGGKNDPTKFYIEPTVVQNVTEKDSLMQEEIFGPILPLVTCESFSEAVDFINSREIPLAGYCFSKGNNKYIKDNSFLSFLNQTNIRKIVSKLRYDVAVRPSMM